MTNQNEQPWWGVTNVHEKLMVKKFIKGLESEPLATRVWKIKPLPQEFRKDTPSMILHRKVNKKLSLEYFGVPEGYNVNWWGICPLWDGSELHLKVYHKQLRNLDNEYGIVMGYWNNLREVRREKTEVIPDWGNVLIETGFNSTKCSIYAFRQHHWPGTAGIDVHLKKGKLEVELDFNLIRL